MPVFLADENEFPIFEMVFRSYSFFPKCIQESSMPCLLICLFHTRKGS